MLAEAAAQVAPVVSEARTLDRFIAPAAGAAVVAGAQSVVELGSRFHQLVPRSRSRALEAAQSQSDLAAVRNPLAKLEAPRRRTGPAQPRSTTPIAASANISTRTAPGAHATPAFCGRVPWPISPPNSACTSRSPSIPAAWASWPAITSRAPPISDIPLVGIGLFYGQGYFRQRLDRDGWQQEEYLETDVNQLPMEPAIGTTGEPVTVQIETRSGSIRAKVWRVKVGRCDLAAARFQRGRQCARGSRTHFAPLRRRWPRPHPPGTAAGRGRLPRAESAWASRPAFCTERRAQRVRRAGSDSQPHGRRGHQLRAGRAARLPGSGLHHPYSRARRPRSLRCRI